MRATFVALICSLFLLAGTTAAVAAPGAANAIWNARAKDNSVAVWIYDKEGSCEELRKGGAQPLAIGTKNLKAGAASGPLPVKELNYCILFVADATAANPEGVSTNCASGSIEFSYDAQANEYRGKYDMTMKDKTVRRGEFRAPFCKAAEPVKK